MLPQRQNHTETYNQIWLQKINKYEACSLVSGVCISICSALQWITKKVKSEGEIQLIRCDSIEFMFVSCKSMQSAPLTSVAGILWEAVRPEIIKYQTCLIFTIPGQGGSEVGSSKIVILTPHTRELFEQINGYNKLWIRLSPWIQRWKIKP